MPLPAAHQSLQIYLDENLAKSFAELVQPMEFADHSVVEIGLANLLTQPNVNQYPTDFADGKSVVVAESVFALLLQFELHIFVN